ncbi:glycosyltransferase family 2 protein [Paenibacillus chitinolyticus]|uniref:glycosyltransferase family 2 protein n=1 Tax=Paenibacillus chitinolyticus TaxID=79263 RepID=UPI003670A60C
MGALTSIIILTRNGLKHTRACVESVQKYTSLPYEFIFVDNGSTDGTLAYLSTVRNATVLANSVNKGFAGGCNQGIRAAKGDYLLLLNNDVVVTENWLEGLRGWLDWDRTIGIVGPVSCNVAPIQRIQPDPYQTMDEMQRFACKWREQNIGIGFYPHRLIGFCMLFHKNLIETIGGFDERFYPGGYEDDDFCLRARLSGKILWAACDVYVHHHGHATFTANGLVWNEQGLYNAEIFRNKWNLEVSAVELEKTGYNPSLVVEKVKTFCPEKHFVPLGEEEGLA